MHRKLKMESAELKIKMADQAQKVKRPTSRMAAATSTTTTTAATSTSTTAAAMAAAATAAAAAINLLQLKSCRQQSSKTFLP